MIAAYLASGILNVCIAFYFKGEDDPSGRELISPIVFMIASGPFGLAFTLYTIISMASDNE